VDVAALCGNERLSILADVGSTVFSLEGAFVLSGSTLAAYNFAPGNAPYEAAVCFGLTDWRYVFADPGAAQISAGASGRFSYDMGSWRPFVRLGAGIPAAIEQGSASIGRSAFPLDLWPDICAGTAFDLN